MHSSGAHPTEERDPALPRWRQHLASLPLPLNLPTDRPRLVVTAAPPSAHYPFSLPAPLVQGLVTLAAQSGATLADALLAALMALFHRYSGQAELLIAVPTVQATLLVRGDLRDQPDFRALLAQLQQARQAEEAAPAPPLATLAREGAPPLQLCFAMQPQAAPAGPLGAGGELAFLLWPDGQGLGGVLTYRADLFDASTIARLVTHLHTLLGSLLAAPDQAVATLPLLPDAERQRLLVEWNQTAHDFSDQHLIHELFEAQAARTPDAIAVESQGRHLTYSALDQQANQLAHHLQEQGLGPDALVGLCTERSVEMIVGILGVLKAGAAYLPLNPDSPPDRLAFMLEDARVPLLLTEASVAARLDLAAYPLLALDSEWPRIAAQPTTPPAPRATPDNLAYVIYTSGSTGRPKGVMLQHRGLCNLAQAQSLAFGLRQGERVLQFANLSFDASVWEIVMALLSGATLCLSDSRTLRFGEDAIYQTLREQAITTATLPPSVLTLLPTSGLEALQTVISAGESCPPDLLARWSPGRRFFNAYGPTETTICATMTLWEPSEGRAPHIGRPLPNVEIYILDAQGQPAPIGVAGELLVGGVGLARGYLRRPALTAEKFIPHPFSSEPGARLYRTGDLARYLPDGTIEFLGRIDHQVKIRGFRIEVGEIEATLTQHPAVREAVVLAREDQPGVKRLVAYIVATEARDATASLLRAFLASRLPDYMLPAVFVWLDALPLTPNGKIDRRALPQPDPTRPDLDVPFVAPRTPIEAEVAALWGDLLGLERVGIHDSFFVLGGHSLLATQLLARVREQFRVEVPLHTIFVTPTVADLALAIEGQTRQPAPAAPAVLRPMPRTANLPLSFAQEQVWFIQELNPTNHSYSAQATLHLAGQLDVPALEWALSEIVRRHEIMRTTFDTVVGRPIQRIHEPWQVHLPVADISHLSESEQEAAVQRLFREACAPFTVTELPLVRWQLIRRQPDAHLLIHVEHHFVHDGWSYNRFLRELVALYEAHVTGQPATLPDLPIQFADFALWQREWVAGEEARRQLAYWCDKLAGTPPLLELPTDYPRPAVQRGEGSSLRIELDGALAQRLRAFARQEGTTLYMTLLAAFLTLLHRYTAQEDIAIGTSVANRRSRETETLLGMIVNMVVLRTDLSGNPSFRALLDRVRQVTLEAYDNQDLPFEKIVEALQPERSLSYNPLFQVAFSFHDSPLPRLTLPGLTVDVTEALSNGSAKFDLNIVVIPRSEQRVGQSEAAADRVTMVWEYNSDLFDPRTVERLTQHYQTLLHSLVAHPERPLTELPLLSERERQRLLVEWNQGVQPYPATACIHQLVEAQAAQQPDALALVAEGQHLSYGDLNRRANQLAHRLRALGVGPEVPVALYLERSVDLIVALLATLKAGGAYLPIDPGYPPERIAFMLEDSQPPVLLTHARLAAALPPSARGVLDLDQARDSLAALPDDNPAVPMSASNLAYLIYTSGSTGRPKGVAIQHEGVVNLIAWYQQSSALCPTDSVAQCARPAFDASVLDIWPTLAAGASLHLPDEACRSAPDYLASWLIEQGITVTFLPTPLAEAVLEQPWPAEAALRVMHTGGDVLHHWPNPMHPFTLINDYGPTENSVVATSARLVPLAGQRRLPPIGRPLPNTQLYLLDTHLEPVPIGVPGELYIGGIGLARGYRNRAALTAERFVPNPFSAEPGARLYRTGDLGRYLPDGSVEYLRRNDGQVKLRGFRIELGEIESVLDQHPAMQEAIVLVQGTGAGSQALVAYLVPHEGSDLPAIPDLTDYLRERLPDYMVPSAFVPLAALPMTTNGKLDRRALPQPDWGNLLAEQPFTAPRAPTEERLAAIWGEVLRQERLSVHDNFFALGGHSLLATQVLSRLRLAFSVELPLSQLFEHPTIATLAAQVDAARAQPGAAPTLAPLASPVGAETLLARLDDLSDEEVERLLAQMGELSG